MSFGYWFIMSWNFVLNSSLGSEIFDFVKDFFNVIKEMPVAIGLVSDVVPLVSSISCLLCYGFLYSHLIYFIYVYIYIGLYEVDAKMWYVIIQSWSFSFSQIQEESFKSLL